MTFANDQWQEAIVQLANNGITVAPASDIIATGAISADQGAVSVTFGNGAASWSVEATGTFNAGTTLFFEFQMTGSGAWYPAFGVPIGSTGDVAASSVVGGASITYQGNAAGFQAFRVRAHPFAGGDSVTVKIVGSVATDGGFVSKSLPPGSNLIGGVNVQQVGGVATQMSTSDGVAPANIQGETQYLLAAGGPVLTSGLPSQLSYDRMTTIQGKRAQSVAITSTTAGDANLACAAGALKLVAPGQKIQLSGSGTNEDVLVTTAYVPSTSATSIPLQSPVVNTGQTTAKFDGYDAKGTQGNAMLPHKLFPVILAHEDSSSAGNFYNAVSASNDGQTAAKYPEFAMGVFNGNSVDRVRGNLDNISLIAASGTTTTQTGADQTNFNGRGVIVVLDMTVVGTGSVTLEIDGKDPVSGKYFALLTGAAVVTNSTNVYQLYPGVTVAANAAVSSPLPRTWRVKVTANNANAVTYTCGAIVLK